MPLNLLQAFYEVDYRTSRYFRWFRLLQKK